MFPDKKMKFWWTKDINPALKISAKSLIQSIIQSHRHRINNLTRCSGVRCEYLVLLKQRPADVAVQRVSKVILEVHESLCELIRMLGVVDGHHKQVDEPREWVLIHRVDVCQVGDAKEQNRGMQRDRFVAHTSHVNLVFSFFSDCLWSTYNLYTYDWTASHK